MLTNAPRGTKDIYGSYMNTWKKFENSVNDICNNFGFKEIRTPIFEHTELFQRGVGETTDIVQKEMYSFRDKGKRDITLKPEGTAGVVRAYLERKMYADAQPTKLFYLTPAFRYERPQAGRYRQFHQFGVELFGSEKPTADAEVHPDIACTYSAHAGAISLAYVCAPMLDIINPLCLDLFTIF